MAEVEKSRSMWTNVDSAMARMKITLDDIMGEEPAKTFLDELETLITELVKAPPRGKSHPSRKTS